MVFDHLLASVAEDHLGCVLDPGVSSFLVVFEEAVKWTSIFLKRWGLFYGVFKKLICFRTHELYVVTT